MKEKYKYGSKLEFIHTKEIFEEKDKELLEFILKQSEIIRFVNSNANSNYRYYGKSMNEGYIALNNTGIDEMFEILKGKQVAFQKDYKETTIELKEEEPNLHFIIKRKGKNEYKIALNENIDILRDLEILYGSKK